MQKGCWKTHTYLPCHWNTHCLLSHGFSNCYQGHWLSNCCHWNCGQRHMDPFQHLDWILDDAQAMPSTCTPGPLRSISPWQDLLCPCPSRASPKTPAEDQQIHSEELTVHQTKKLFCLCSLAC